MSMKFPERHSLAARFVGKEAVAKAFGTGIGKAMGWRNIDIERERRTFPGFFRTREAFAAERKVSLQLLSLYGNTENYAIACAVLQSELSDALLFVETRCRRSAV